MLELIPSKPNPENMKYALIVSTALLTSPLCFSQSIQSDSTVCMPLSAYRMLSVKWYECDTVIGLKNEEIRLKDSLHVIDSIKYESCQNLNVQKDVTIKEVKSIAQEKVKPNGKVVLLSFTLGVLLTLLVSR